MPAPNITTDKWVLIESGKLAGVEPTTTFHETRGAAKVAGNPRRDLFARVDIAQVKFRRLVTNPIVGTEVEDD